jgi:hypothetical protein
MLNGFALPKCVSSFGEAAPRQFVEGAAFDEEWDRAGKPEAFRGSKRRSRQLVRNAG